MAKMVGGDMLSSINYRGKEHNRTDDGDFDVDDGDVEGMRKHFGLKTREEAAAESKK